MLIETLFSQFTGMFPFFAPTHLQGFGHDSVMASAPWFP
jgi:hypothetical protein